MVELQFLWGCDPQLQLECSWLRSLLPAFRLSEWEVSQGLSADVVRRDQPCVLVESGIQLLERHVDDRRLKTLQHQRRQRLDQLAGAPHLLLLHISDEEGTDAERLYPMLPPQCTIWRNFSHPRLEALHSRLRHFPIGPRGEFLEPSTLAQASQRPWPWAFMGTLWRSGSRTVATSLFLHALPNGQFYGGSRFGQGVPLTEYRQTLANSVFALCPEGDRHFDTFRLYESLQMGCLPLVVERQHQAVALLGPTFPMPIFEDWRAALAFAQAHLSDPARLNQHQARIGHWWEGLKTQCIEAMRRDLLQDC